MQTCITCQTAETALARKAAHANVEAVVHCKDCAHRCKGIGCITRSGIADVTQPDDFCRRGKRKPTNDPEERKQP